MTILVEAIFEDGHFQPQRVEHDSILAWRVHQQSGYPGGELDDES